MTKLKVGISCYGRDEGNFYRLPAEYVEAVQKAGALPYLLTPNVQDRALWVDSIDVMMLAGGGDINPKLYGEAPHQSLYSIDDERDAAEYNLVEILLKTQKPTLAICRGMQMINVVLGGSLYQHIPDHFGETVLHRLPERKLSSHVIVVEPNSHLGHMLKQLRFEAPSWHHQAIKKLAKPLRAVAFAEDGVIEAVESDAYPNLIAIQWHPELSQTVFPCEFFLKQLLGH